MSNTAQTKPCEHYMSWDMQGGYSYCRCMKCDFIDGEKTFKDPLQKSYAAGLAEGEKRARIHCPECGVMAQNLGQLVKHVQLRHRLDMAKMENLGEWWKRERQYWPIEFLHTNEDMDRVANIRPDEYRKVRLFAIPLEEKEKEVKQ